MLVWFDLTVHWAQELVFSSINTNQFNEKRMWWLIKLRISRGGLSKSGSETWEQFSLCCGCRTLLWLFALSALLLCELQPPPECPPKAANLSTNSSGLTSYPREKWLSSPTVLSRGLVRERIKYTSYNFIMCYLKFKITLEATTMSLSLLFLRLFFFFFFLAAPAAYGSYLARG